VPNAMTATAFLKRAFCCSIRFELIPGEAHGDRSLNELHRNNEGLLSLDRRENPSDPIKAPTPNADSLPSFQKRVQLERDSMLKHALHCGDLLVGNRRANTSGTQEAVHPVGAQNLDARSLGGHNAHEDITRKQRYLDQTLSIAPLVLGGKKREKDLDAFFLKLMGNLFLVTESRLNRKPSERPATCHVHRQADRGAQISTGLKGRQDEAPPK
jgi:hypothetical protein